MEERRNASNNNGDSDFKEEGEEEVRQKRRELVWQGEEALEFVLLALERIQRAREQQESGEVETALETLNEQLLQRLEASDEQADKQLVIPTHLRVLLLLER